MNPIYCLFVLACSVFLTACGSDGSSQTPPGPETLPLLGDSDIHLYTQEAYEGFAPVVATAVEGRYLELVNAGMDTARHLFEWSNIEIAPGVYDFQDELDAMDYRTSLGIVHQFCNLSILDSGDASVPQYIQDLLDMGAGWDDPQIKAALRNLLDEAVPLFLDRGLFMFGLSNEPGPYYDDFPLLATSFEGLVEDAIDHIHSIEPKLACTVVFAGVTDSALPTLMPLLDVASFNFYYYDFETDPGCTFSGFPLDLYRATAPIDIGMFLDELIAVSQGKLICVQETGQSTGWADLPATLGPHASLENQRACFEALRIELHVRRTHFRTICNWVLNDFSPAGIQFVADPLIADGFPACFTDNLTEIFGPTGLVRSDDTASIKPAFTEYKDAIAFFAQ